MKCLRNAMSLALLAGFASIPLHLNAQDWDTVTGGDYGIRNTSNSNTIPFTIESGTPVDSYYLSSDGNLGLGDAPPTGIFSPRFYISDQTPEIELDDVDDNQVWQLFADGGDVSQGGSNSLGGIGFFDSTAGRLPFFVESEAPNASLYIKTDGFLGAGTADPIVNLHVLGASADPVQEVFRLESNTAPQQAFNNSGTGSTWFFAMTANDTFKVSFDGTGAVEARFFQNGDLRLRGVLLQNSDRRNKKNIKEIDAVDILEKVAELPVTTWEYKSTDGVMHMGPMAQDFYEIFGLGSSPTSISSIDTGGVALAAIKGLKQEKDDELSQLQTETASLAAENAELRERLRNQEERMLELELIMTELARSSSKDLEVVSNR